MAKRFDPLLTPEEYLEMERASEIRHEYIDGRVYAMTGGTRAHSDIITNLARELANQVRGGPCRLHLGNLRIKVTASGRYTYPDLSIACREPTMEDEHDDTMLNPTVVIEVLSRSTEQYDRGEKREHFQRIESLRCFVAVAQHRMWAEIYTRADDAWTRTEIEGADAVLRLDAAGCAVALRDVYEGVDLERAAARRRSKNALNPR
jgi:Uma2 family endonuclease